MEIAYLNIFGITKIKWITDLQTRNRRNWRCSGVFIVNFEQISHMVLVCLLLTFNN